METNLDKYFQPLNSPISKRQAVRSSFDFDSEQERNSVDLAHIRNFNFSQGTGGTLTLGGTANGNGLLYIRNAAGSLIVQGDNTGLTIYNGNIVVKNSSNTTIIDTAGIVSTANFANDEVTDATNNSTTSTSPTTVPGSTLDAFVLARSARAIVSVLSFGYNVAWVINSSTMQVQCKDSVDGTLLGYSLTNEWRLTAIDGTANGWSMDVDDQLQAVSALVDLSAGTHTLSLEYYVNGSGTAHLDLFQLGYVILGV